jgi:hypothetical protein
MTRANIAEQIRLGVSLGELAVYDQKAVPKKVQSSVAMA